VRQVGGVLLFLVLVFGVLKPIMTRLTKQIVYAPQEALAGAAAGEGGLAGSAEGGGGYLPESEGEALHLPGPRSYERTLDAARGMIAEDPKRVAQVVKKWIAEDGH
ncbi:MAG: flagellar M-ring protein FliF, partial [Candidatus Thiodiazotropha sp.]